MRVLLLGLLLTGCFNHSGLASEKKVPPKFMLWSWFMPDDFRPLANPDVGVAYRALSLSLDSDQIRPDPRLSPVRIASGTYKLAVVRFDFDHYSTRYPTFSARQRSLALEMIGDLVSMAHPNGVQIDFDAPPAALVFYRELLTSLRRQLGPNIFLSVTALGEWCTSKGDWLKSLPVDEIVPMGISLGSASPILIRQMQEGALPQPSCRSSIGIDVGGGWAKIRPRSYRRVYFFPAAQSWSPTLLRKAIESLQP